MIGLKKILFGIFVVCQILSCSLNAQEVEFIDETLFCLPENSPVKIRWVVSPMLDKSFNQVSFVRKYSGFMFSVDPGGNAWLGFDNQVLCMNKQIAFRLKEPFLHMIHLANGAMAFATMLELGFADVPETDVPELSDGMPVLPFQPFTRLPGTYARIFPFGINSICAVVESAGKTVAYLLTPDKGEGGYRKMAVRSWKKLFEVEASIQAVASQDATVYGKLWFAVDNCIYCYDEIDNSFLIRARFPEGAKIQQLAAMKDNVFYATDRQIGVLGAANYQVFAHTPQPRLFCRNNRLFVLLTGCMGVIEVENAGELRRVLN